MGGIKYSRGLSTIENFSLYSYFRNRMLRSSSSTKENGRVGYKVPSNRKRRMEHQLSTLSSTQAFFPHYQLSQMNSPNLTPNPFYKTLGSNNFIQGIRPESKQAYRKFISRPETSKGTRVNQRPSRKWQNDAKGGQYHSHYVPEREVEEYREESSSNIEIIVTNSRKTVNNITRGEKSKFETDLDDEFLQLFAN